MKEWSKTKKSLLAAILAVVLCLAMLVGTTLAWFTDTASTSVNVIQSGTLDVELWQGENDAKLGSDALKWVKAAGHESDAVLWEPGATYDLESFRIKNNGNLALKYKIEIGGIIGDEKLAEAIDFTVKIGDNEKMALDQWTEGALLGGAVTEKITISGTMKTDAGNEYQGKSIEGIAIAVYATQDTVEYDSYSNDYDALADFDSIASIKYNNDTITLSKSSTKTVGSATVTVDDGGNITYRSSGDAQTVSITTTGGILTVNAPNDTIDHYGALTKANIEAISSNSYHEYGTVGVLSVKKTGRVVVENGNNITSLIVENSGSSGEHNPKIEVPSGIVLETSLRLTNANATIYLCVGSTSYTAKVAEGKLTLDSTSTTPAELVKMVGGNVITNSGSYRAIDSNGVLYDYMLNAIDTTNGNSSNITNKEITLLDDATGLDSAQIYPNRSYIINGGSFTIEAKDNYSAFNVAGGTLTLNSGTYTGKTSGVLIRVAAQQVNDSKLIINGGTYKNDGEDHKIVSTSNMGSRKGELIINGGTFYNWDPTDYVTDITNHTIMKKVVGSDTIWTVIEK